MKRCSLFLAAAVCVAALSVTGCLRHESTVQANADAVRARQERANVLIAHYQWLLSEQAPPASNFCASHDFYNRYATFVEKTEAFPHTGDTTKVRAILLNRWSGMNYPDITDHQMAGEYDRRRLVLANSLREHMRANPGEVLPSCGGMNVLSLIHDVYYGSEVIDRAFFIGIARAEIFGRDQDLQVSQRFAMFTNTSALLRERGRDQIAQIINLLSLNDDTLRRAGVVREDHRAELLGRATGLQRGSE